MLDDFSKLLYEAVLHLESVEECEAFFEDICTRRELESLSQRLCVAACLKRKRTYAYITERVGASSVTISRINRAMQSGSGYGLALERIGSDRLADL
ncbi:MAG: hypothetical protein LBC41_11995 [Clostridiales bacterium]|jgi:TrpR-related protein YerC/YecD|nr:hypothetical protein [Clostridiales bacterium]MDR2751374.1 hypothetical protein [Clostridiales bacterium]